MISQKAQLDLLVGRCASYATEYASKKRRDDVSVPRLGHVERIDLLGIARTRQSYVRGLPLAYKDSGSPDVQVVKAMAIQLLTEANAFDRYDAAELHELLNEAIILASEGKDYVVPVEARLEKSEFNPEIIIPGITYG